MEKALNPSVLSILLGDPDSLLAEFTQLGGFAGGSDVRPSVLGDFNHDREIDIARADPAGVTVLLHPAVRPPYPAASSGRGGYSPGLDQPSRRGRDAPIVHAAKPGGGGGGGGGQQFHQCSPSGYDCNILITLDRQGFLQVDSNPNMPWYPYPPGGWTDIGSLIGFQNDSNAVVHSLSFNAKAGIPYEAAWLCGPASSTFAPVASNVSIVNSPNTANFGVHPWYYYNACAAGVCPDPRIDKCDVVFAGGIAKGQSTYFNLHNVATNYPGYFEVRTRLVIPWLSFQDFLPEGTIADAVLTLFASDPASVTLILTTTAGTGSAVFADTNTATKTVTLSGGSLPVPIKGVAVSSASPNIRLQASVSGIDRELNFTVVSATFKEDAPCSGYDDSVAPNWIMAPNGVSNTALAEITPSAVANQVNFESADTGKATVSPATATGSPQTITVLGVAKGETEIQARTGSAGTIAANLRVTAKDNVSKTIAIHAITEDNDDDQVIPVGNGKAGETCITAGADAVLNTSPSGDDAISGDTITAGLDGICITTAQGDDVAVIAVGRGKPNAVCVTKGANGFRDTIPIGDDAVTGDDVDTGADGICDTTANSSDVVPYNVPSAASLQSYLNDVYGNQANVFFTVTRSDHALNYDLDRNGGVPDPPNESEMNLIAAAAATPGVDANVYFVRVLDVPIATARSAKGDAFIQSATGGTAENVTAHEIGHILGLSHNDTEVVNLMHSSSVNGCQLQKFEWDRVNP